MTQLRKQKDAISNYFDSILHGIGHRGSSFMDGDAFTHDAMTRRWLVQEFKHEGERLDKAQHWMLSDLAQIPEHFTVWIAIKRTDGQIGWADFRDARQTYRVITVKEYQDRFRAWWQNEAYVIPPLAVVAEPQPSPLAVEYELLVDEITW